jgi:hypothetical protein
MTPRKTGAKSKRAPARRPAPKTSSVSLEPAPSVTPPTAPPPMPRPLALPPGVASVADLGTLYTLRQVADRLELSTKTVRRMVDRGELVGAHMAPMPGGVGEQWVVPYSTVLQVERERQATRKTDPTAQELEGLRARVAELEQALAVERVRSEERQRSLEAVHLTWRLSLEAPKRRRRWGRPSSPGAN